MTWWVFFILSLSCNLFGIFYIRWLLRNLVHASDGLSGIWEIIDGYTEHVKTVNELEMFYGDETLASLIRHGKEMSSVLEEYKATYQIFDTEVDGSSIIAQAEEK